MLSVERSADGSRFYFFVRKVKKSGIRTPWNSRRWFLAMEKIELIDTGRLTEKQARLNMEKCAEFLARMIQKYGDVVLAQIGDSDIFYVRQPYDDGQPK